MTAPEPGMLAAAVEALADEWEQTPGNPGYYDNLRWGRAAAQRLRNLLAAHSERGEGTEGAVERVLGEHILFGYRVCSCGEQMHRYGDHRAHVAAALRDAGVNLRDAL